MKRLLLIALTILSIHAIAQTNTFPLDGNVGIGTTNPQAKLDVNNSVRISPYAVGAIGTGYMNTGTELKLLNGNIYNPGGNSITKISFGGMYNPSGSSPIDCIYNSIAWASGQLKIQNNQQDKIIIGGGDEWGQQNVSINPQGGNVGIGTTNPQAKLDVQGKLHVGGEIYGYNMLTFQDDSRFSVTSATIPSLTYSPFSMPQYGIAAPNTGGSADLWIAGSNAIRMFTAGNPTPGVNILSSGNVGIGTQNPAYKLDVLGTIRAKEVLVNLDGGADFVFEKGYKLLPIEHVANYVQENKHLPDIPSANEMVKNGVSMGDMQVKLLQKVEELTLYAIQQNKKIQDQGEKLLEQEKKNNELEIELKSLKELVTKNSTGEK